MNPKLKELIASLMEELAKPPEDRDVEALAARTKAVTDWLADHGEDDETDVKAMRVELGQLRTDLDAMVEELRETRRRQAAASRPQILLAQPGSRMRPQFRFSTPEVAREFGDFCRRVFLARTGGAVDKALTPSTDAEGGYVIPESFSAELAYFIESVGVAEQIAGSVPLPAGTLKIPRRLTGADVYWKAPGAEATESTPTFGQMEMAAETLIALIETYLEFEEDALIDVGNFIATEFGISMAQEKDRAAFVGTGIGTDGGITGLLNSTKVTIVDMATADDALTDLDSIDYLVDCETSCWEGALGEAEWLAHRTVKAQVSKIKDSASMPVWRPAAGGEPPTLMGYPITTASQMRASADIAAETTFLGFGAFRRGLLMGKRGQLAIDYSSVPGFRTLSGFWRCYQRLDVGIRGYTSAEITANPQLANPIVVLKTGAAS